MNVEERLLKEGRLIEAGWMSFRVLVLPKDASEIQVREMRKAFFAGAHHLFGSVMSVLSPGDGVTDRDLLNMTLITNELEAFQVALAKEIGIEFSPGSKPEPKARGH